MKNYTFRASLRVFGGSVEHEDICKILGMTPKWLYRAGEPRVSPKGELLGGVYPSNYCVIELVTGSDSSLSEFVDEQTRALLVHKELFKNIKKSSGRVEFFLGWFIDENFGEILLSETLMLMGELGIDLSFDIYPPEKKGRSVNMI